MKQCIACLSEDVINVVENNHIFYFCKTCSSKSTRCIDSDTQFEHKNIDGFQVHVSVAALIKKDDKYLLIERRDFPYGLSLPVGHVKFQEPTDYAIKRKVLEETGLTLDSSKLVHSETFTDYCKYGAELHEWNVFNCYTSGILVAGFESSGFIWATKEELGSLELTGPTKYILSRLGLINEKYALESKMNLSSYVSSKKIHLEHSLIQDLPFPVIVFSSDASIFQINKNASNLLGTMKNQDLNRYLKLTKLLKQIAKNAIQSKCNLTQNIELGESEFSVHTNVTYKNMEPQFATLTIKTNSRNISQEIDESLSFQTSVALTAKKNSLRAAETILKQYFYNSQDLDSYALYYIKPENLKKRIAHSNRSIKYKSKVDISSCLLIQSAIKNRTSVTTIGTELEVLFDKDPGYDHYLIVPVVVDDFVKAIILLGKNPQRYFSEREIKKSQVVANKIGIVMEANELYNELSEERMLLNGILSTTTNGIIVVKGNRDIRYINDAAVKMLNLDNKPTTYHQILKLSTEANKRKLASYLEKVLQSQESHSTEFITSKKPYKNLQAFFSPIVNAHSKSMESLLVFNDITEIKRKQERINDKNKKISTIIRNTADGIVVFDAKGKVIMHNKIHDLLDKLSGFKKNDEAAMHKFFNQIYPDLDRFELNDNFYEEIKFKDLDNDDYWVGITYSCAKDRRGKILFVIATVRDIMREKVFNNKQKEFIYSITHELRTPITAIKGYLSMIIGGDVGEISSAQKVYFDRVYKSTDKLVRLVEDILQAARIENEKVNFSINDFNPSDLVNEVISDFSSKAQHKGLGLEIDEKSKNIILKGDVDKVRQVLSNLIDNAIKYSIEGKIIVKISPAVNGGIISVRDTGVGLTQKNQKLIFDKFYRVPNSLAIQEGGTGLGLFIAKSLIEKQGGTLTVKSKPNKGSEFIIGLPLVEPNNY